MNITLKGTITDIFQEEVYGNFSKRIFWLKEPDKERYPNHYELQMQQNNCSTLDNFRCGDEVTCHVDIKGRRYSKNGKEGCINSLVCWKIEKVVDHAQQQREATNNFYTPSNQKSTQQAPADDLPF